jgi:hypothetical protein
MVQGQQQVPVRVMRIGSCQRLLDVVGMIYRNVLHRWQRVPFTEPNQRAPEARGTAPAAGLCPSGVPWLLPAAADILELSYNY